MDHQLSQPNRQRKSLHADSMRSDVPDVTEQMVESILDQAHLCPLPAVASPVHWELDHALRLVPLPHLVSHADIF
jgi:DNA polymerase epsilon subunit 2